MWPLSFPNKPMVFFGKARDRYTRFLSSSKDNLAWSLTMSLTIALAAVLPLAEGLFTAATELAHFRDRAIGITTLQGVDASNYAYIWIRIHLSFLSVAFAAFLLATLLGNWIEIRRFSRERDGVVFLCELAIVVMLLDLFIGDRLLRSMVAILFGLTVLILVKVIFQRRARNPALEALLSNHRLLIAVFLPLPLLFLVRLVQSAPFSFGYRSLAGYAFALAVFFFLCITLGRKRDPQDFHQGSSSRAYRYFSSPPRSWWPTSCNTTYRR